MSMPLRNLPVIQNWDCHSCSNCCRELEVAVSDEERQRIEAQGWQDDPDIGDLPLFVRAGWWSRGYRLNHLESRGCIFLSKDNRCRIHERFGPEAKPLACRLYPFVLVPAGDHWRVGIRFACPSAAENKGKPLGEHSQELNRLATEYEERQELAGRTLRLPLLQAGQQVEWADLFRFVKTLQAIMANRADPVERRLRKWLALAGTCRQAKFDAVKGKKLTEFLEVLRAALEEEVPRRPDEVPPPSWIGRSLFRQMVAIYGRKDHGPLRGIVRQGRLALLRASLRFARGSGFIPKINARIGDITFAEVENNREPLDPAAEEIFERYYLVKLESLQFFGTHQGGLAFWDGLEQLTMTYPMVRWLARAVGVGASPQAAAIALALSIVDDHFATNPILQKSRYQVPRRILTNRGELPRLIAWYGRTNPENPGKQVDTRD